MFGPVVASMLQRTLVTVLIRARICKRLRSPGIDSEESIPQAYVAQRAGTTNRVAEPARQAGSRFLGSWKGLQVRAQAKDINVVLNSFLD